MLDMSNKEDQLVGWHVAGPGFSLTTYDKEAVEEIRKVVASYAKCELYEVTATKVFTDLAPHPDAVVRRVTLEPFQKLQKSVRIAEQVGAAAKHNKVNTEKIREVVRFVSDLRATFEDSDIAAACRPALDKINDTKPIQNVYVTMRRLIVALVEEKITEDEVLALVYARFSNN